MKQLDRKLPLGFRVTVYIWILFNVIALGLYVVGSETYRAWFTQSGICLLALAEFSAPFIAGHYWRERQ
jgi:hypothetical protein